MLVWFTADEHYFHKNIIAFSSRPFDNLHHMHSELIRRHNEVVSQQDTTIHCGDFSLGSKNMTHNIIRQLNGEHVFLMGSHDSWLDKKKTPSIHQVIIDKQLMVCCHYAMRVWPKSHYGSYHVYGHSHGRLSGQGKSMDIGVDCHRYYPISFEKIRKILENTKH